LNHFYFACLDDFQVEYDAWCALNHTVFSTDVSKASEQKEVLRELSGGNPLSLYSFLARFELMKQV
jgi:hypothetical protein